MKIFLATLCLNEMEWLPLLYEQHRTWPEMVRWVFVESADAAYRRVNPDMVSGQGLSVDGTSEFLKDLAIKDDRITYIPFGLSINKDAALGKCDARQQYLNVAEDVKPDFIIVLDADEFYTYRSQARVNHYMFKNPNHDSFVFHRVEIWRPPSIANQPLFQYEVVGGFWKIPC